MKLHNAVALVTGANRGIGKQLVLSLLARGARRVYVAVRNPAQAEVVVAHDPARLIAVPLDVSVPTQVAAAAGLAGDVTLVINNAGVLASYDLLAAAPDQLRRDLDVNYLGALAVARAFAPILERARPRGALANVLSIASLAGMPALGGYSASKAAAWSMTQALRAQLRARGVDVHAVFPGPVDTEMVSHMEMAKAAPDAVAEAILDGIERGDEDIAPDPTSAQLVASWTAGPKDVERQFAAM
jgi:NAD(P)-dependent dehydrogenase (short-subunit alcohol dehydrogenase family)